MSFNRWINVVLAILVVIWGGLSVDAARHQSAGSVAAVPVASNTPKQSYITSQVQTSPPQPTSSLTVIEHESTPKQTSSAEAVVRNLFAGRVVTPSPSPVPTATPTIAPTATPVPTSSPITQVSYKIQGGGVFYEGSFDASGLSVGEATKRIAAQRGFTFRYDASALGWYVTEIAGVKQNPAQDNYWLYWVNGVFGDVSSDKKILQSGDSLIWQYGS